MGHSPLGAGTTSRPPGYVLSPKIGARTLLHQYREQSQHTQPAAGHTALAPTPGREHMASALSVHLAPPDPAIQGPLTLPLKIQQARGGHSGPPHWLHRGLASEVASTVTLTPARSEVASRWSRWLTEKVSPPSPGTRKWLHKCAAGSWLWGKHGCSGKSGHTGLLALPQAQFPNL